MKRAFDLLVAVGALVVLTPVLATVSVLVGVFVGRPVLFQQERSGLGGAPFQIMKFRSMLDTRDDAGELLPDDDRQSRLGTWLRRLSLDELPALLNVVRGEMSIVGPRPFIHDYFELYTPEQARRCDVRPGITGWAQINGRNELTWEEKFELDVWYVDNRTTLLDIKIIGRTVLKVLKGSGVSSSGMTTAPRFLGTPLPPSDK